MQRAPTHVHHLQLLQNILAEVLQEKELRVKKHHHDCKMKQKDSCHSSRVLIAPQYEKQRFYKGKQGKDKEMAWKLHLLSNHLYQSQDKGKFYSHYHPLQTYQEPIVNLSCEPISRTLISRRFQDME